MLRTSITNKVLTHDNYSDWENVCPHKSRWVVSYYNKNNPYWTYPQALVLAKSLHLNYTLAESCYNELEELKQFNNPVKGYYPIRVVDFLGNEYTTIAASLNNNSRAVYLNPFTMDIPPSLGELI
jgi:hypothetical protein